MDDACTRHLVPLEHPRIPSQGCAALVSTVPTLAESPKLAQVWPKHPSPFLSTPSCIRRSSPQTRSTRWRRRRQRSFGLSGGLPWASPMRGRGRSRALPVRSCSGGRPPGSAPTTSTGGEHSRLPALMLRLPWASVASFIRSVTSVAEIDCAATMRHDFHSGS